MVLDNSAKIHLCKTGRPSIWTKMIEPFPPFGTLAQERPHQVCAQVGQQGRVSLHLASVSVSPSPVKAKYDGASLDLPCHYLNICWQFIGSKNNNTHSEIL